MFLSEKFIIEKIEPVKLAKYASMGSGIGASVGAAKGFISGLRDEMEENHFIEEWRDKLRTANSEKQKREALHKLNYWIDLRNKKRIEHAKLKMKVYARIGAVSGGVTGAGLSLK